MAAKTAVHEATESNIRNHVSSLSYSTIVVEDLLEEIKLNYSGREYKAKYRQEVDEIKHYLQQNVGRTWVSLKKKNKFKIFSGMEVDMDAWAWKKIEFAVTKFDDWFEEHAKLFEMDSSFADSVSGDNLDMLDFRNE